MRHLERKMNTREKFKKDGYVLLRNFLDEELILDYLSNFISVIEGQKVRHLTDLDCNNLFVNLTEKLQNLKNTQPKEFYIGLLKSYTMSVQSKRIMNAPKLLSVISDLMETETISQIGNPVLHVVGNKLSFDNQSLNAPWHQDWPALKTSKRTLVVWIPFGGAFGDGKLKLKKNSHNSGVFETKAISNVYEIKHSSIKNFESVSYEMHPTDCLIFDSFTAHGSENCEHVRLAMSFRFENLMCEEWRGRNYQHNHKYSLQKEEQLD